MQGKCENWALNILGTSNNFLEGRKMDWDDFNEDTAKPINLWKRKTTFKHKL